MIAGIRAARRHLHEFGDERQLALPQADSIELQQMLGVAIAQYLRSHPG